MPIWTCSICKDSLNNNCNVSAICCGHVFHQKCILQWFCANRKLPCPQCRKEVREEEDIILKLFFDAEEQEDPALEAESLRREVDQLNALLLSKEKEQAEWQTCVCLLQEELAQQQLETKAAMDELQEFRREMRAREDMEMVLGSQAQEVQMLIRLMGTGPEALVELASYSLSLTKECNNLKEAQKESAELIEKLKREFDSFNERSQKADIEFERSREELDATQSALIAIKNKFSVSRKEVKDAEVIVSVKDELELSSPPAAINDVNHLVYDSPEPPGYHQPNICLPGNILAGRACCPTTSVLEYLTDLLPLEASGQSFASLCTEGNSQLNINI